MKEQVYANILSKQVYANILSKQVPLIKQIFKNGGIEDFPYINNLSVTLSKSIVDFPEIISVNTFPISIPFNVQILSRLPLDLINLSFSDNKIEPRLLFKVNMSRKEIDETEKLHNFDVISEAVKMRVSNIVTKILLEIVYSYEKDFLKFDVIKIDLTKNQTIVVGKEHKLIDELFKDDSFKGIPKSDGSAYKIIKIKNTTFIILTVAEFDDYFILDDNKKTLNIYNLCLPKTFDIDENTCIEIFGSYEIF